MLDNERTLRDVMIFIRRARSFNPQAALRLSSAPGALGVFANVISPQNLLDTAPTVLAMRAVPLSSSPEIDTVVDARALELSLQSVADQQKLDIHLPGPLMNVAWAGTRPPASGWVPCGEIGAEDLRGVARSGMDEVARALPDNPGAAVVSTVRNRVWSEPMGGFNNADSEPAQLPRAVALACEIFGFLPRDIAGPIRVLKSENWLRLNAPAGYVLVKTGRGH
ncbi:hypothetical protein VVR12_01915 [Rothia sp. LK2588]|uniref:hypothetical protein n=1 Tax=Rothia sp. LK2588 TaxID=3114369 RepID=UPI0034CDDC88